MDIQTLLSQNPWWAEKSAIEDDYDIRRWKDKKYHWLPQILDKVVLKPFALNILTGPRQSGKTTALKLLIQKLLQKREPQSLFYFNCEHLADYKELTQIIELYTSFKESNDIKNAVLIFDEITLPKEWYRSIKYTIDRGMLENDIIILSGSSSISIKREVELFPGRMGNGLELVLYPLSFRGFVTVVDPKLISKIDPIKSLNNVGKFALKSAVFEKELSYHLENYMRYGGFPLSVAHLGESKEEAKKVYLSWIKNAILKADRSDMICRQIVKVLLESLQSDISWEGIAQKIELKSPKTVASYADLLQSIFVVNVLYNIDISSKKIRFGKNKKIHFQDPLLVEIFEEWCMITLKNKDAALAESMVVDHLSKLFPTNVFFWRGEYEVDAIVFDKSKMYGVEVKWSDDAHAFCPKQIKHFSIITKHQYSKDPLRIPLSIFLSMMDV